MENQLSHTFVNKPFYKWFHKCSECNQRSLWTPMAKCMGCKSYNHRRCIHLNNVCRMGAAAQDDVSTFNGNTLRPSTSWRTESRHNTTADNWKNPVVELRRSNDTLASIAGYDLTGLRQRTIMMDSDGNSDGRPEAQQDPDHSVSTAFKRQLRAARLLCTRLICLLRATQRETNVQTSSQDDNVTTAAGEFDLMHFSDEDLSHTSGELTITGWAVREAIAVGNSPTNKSKNNVDFAMSRLLDPQDNAVDRKIEHYRCIPSANDVAEAADDSPKPATVDQITAECSNVATSDHDDDQLLHDLLQRAPHNVPTTTVESSKRSKTSAVLHRVQDTRSIEAYSKVVAAPDLSDPVKNETHADSHTESEEPDKLDYIEYISLSADMSEETLKLNN